MKILVIITYLCLAGCSTVPRAVHEKLNLPELYGKFKSALRDDRTLNGYYAYANEMENSVTGNIRSDIPSDPDTVSHPFKDYLTGWRHRLLAEGYNGFLFSMTEYADPDGTITIPAHLTETYSHGASQIKLTISEQDYIDAHPLKFLELMEETMLQQHNFRPHVRVTSVDLKAMNLPKTEFLKLTENNQAYSNRAVLGSIQDKPEYSLLIMKYSEWRRHAAKR